LPYDYLEKLGEFRQSPLQQSSEGYLLPYSHGYFWQQHNEPVKSSKAWLTFIGRFGEFWYQVCGTIIPFGTGSNSPLSPAFGGDSHEWGLFTENFSVEGFGNPSTDGLFADVTISWTNDLPDGD